LQKEKMAIPRDGRPDGKTFAECADLEGASIALALVLSIVLSIAHFEDALQQCPAAIIAEANHAVFH
jgi:hypothetical protein